MSYLVFPSGPFATNAYLLYCPRTRHAAIIDPSPGSAKALEEAIAANQLAPKAIWLTHSHWDHIADAAVLHQKYGIEIAAHAEDAPNMENPGSDRLRLLIDVAGAPVAHLLKDEEELALGDLKVLVIHTPGHTPGGVCYFLAREKLLFSGDTLFQGTIGNLSLPTARPSLMWQSCAKLAKLPLDTFVLPGHGTPTTIGQEAELLARAKDLFS
jgi:glyoxylase-like metal-dependent hydrolase (beta-lactamase superfamily II)